MKQILTNALDGYDIQERPSFDASALFRVMSIMALAEGQALNIIEPNAPAQVMTYNPARETQNYVAALTGYSILEDGVSPQVVFQVSALYDTITAGTYYVYYNGRMAEVELLGDDESVGVEGWGEYFLDAINAGMLRSDAPITAHLLKAPVIDMYLDWGGMIRSTSINANSSQFSDIDVRVKAAIKGDTYTSWRAIHPTGVGAVYLNASGGTAINFDTGIICTSVKSVYAPEYLNIVMADHEVRLYLNIDNIPFHCLPSYLMHPGQYLHNKSTDYGTEATLSYSGAACVVKIEGDVGELISSDYPAIIYHGGAAYEVSITYIIRPGGPGNSYIHLDDDDLPEGDIYFQQATYTYTDGALFAAEGDEANYRTPNKARMFILRGVIGYEGLPYVPDENDNLQTIASVEYVFRDEGAYDGVFATYALAHYGIDYGSKPYRETGNIDYDGVESMRFIGHYGRNNRYAYVITDPIALANGEIDEFEIPIYNREQRTLVTAIDEDDFSISGNSLVLNIGNMRANKDDGIEGGNAYYNGDDGFYYYRRDMMPIQAVSNVMVNKVYVTDNFTVDGSLIGPIYAHNTNTGYVCYMQEDELMRVTVGAIDTESDTVVFLGPLANTETPYTILIGDEIITGTSSADGLSMTGLVRGARDTRPAYHAGGSPVTSMHPYFHNTYAGKITEIDGPDIYIDIPTNGATLPDSGHILIQGEIIKYSSCTVVADTIKFITSARAAYGSEQVDLAPGMPVSYVSYFRYTNIHPMAVPSCEYAGKYRPRLTLPLNYPDDPVRHGAIATYLVELRHETSRENQAW